MTRLEKMLEDQFEAEAKERLRLIQLSAKLGETQSQRLRREYLEKFGVDTLIFEVGRDSGKQDYWVTRDGKFEPKPVSGKSKQIQSFAFTCKL